MRGFRREYSAFGGQLAGSADMFGLRRVNGDFGGTRFFGIAVSAGYGWMRYCMPMRAEGDAFVDLGGVAGELVDPSNRAS